MLYFLCSLLLLAMEVQSFKHFKISGNQRVCMVDYEVKTVECKFDTMNECRNDYINHHTSICFLRKSLKLDGAKK